MTDVVLWWSEVRERAVVAFGGESLRPDSEELILEVFKERPTTVVSIIEKTAAAKQSGQVRSGWAIVKRELVLLRSRDVQMSLGPDRDRRVARATRWLENAGVHFDRSSEVLDELFATSYALLRPWHEDEELRREMRWRWLELRRRHFPDEPADDALEPGEEHELLNGLRRAIETVTT